MIKRAAAILTVLTLSLPAMAQERALRLEVIAEDMKTGALDCGIIVNALVTKAESVLRYNRVEIARKNDYDSLLLHISYVAFVLGETRKCAVSTQVDIVGFNDAENPFTKKSEYSTLRYASNSEIMVWDIETMQPAINAALERLINSNISDYYRRNERK